MSSVLDVMSRNDADAVAFLDFSLIVADVSGEYKWPVLKQFLKP